MSDRKQAVFHGWRHASGPRIRPRASSSAAGRCPISIKSSVKSSTASSRRKFDLLLGRKTYEIFAAYWPYYEEDAPHGGIAKLFKDIKKYAVSRSGEVDTNWAGSSAPARHRRREAPKAGRRPEP